MAAITAKKYFENGTCTAQYFTDYNTMCQWLAQHPEAGIEAWEDHQPIDQRQLQADVAAYAAPCRLAWCKAAYNPARRSRIMTHRDILSHIEDHYDEYPNFDGRSPEEVLAELPEVDERYAQGEAGLVDLLNEINYLPPE